MKPYRQRFRKQHLFNVLLLCFSIGATLLISETVLRFVHPSGYYIWPPHLKKIFKPYQDVMPGISGESVFVINSRGIRGDELTPTHTYRIIAIGGSTTECLYLDQSETWPYLLQKALNENTLNHNVWVGNEGMSGKTTRHHIMAMKYLPLREMKIDAVVFLIGINDFSKRLAQDEHYDPKFFAKPKAEEILVAQTFKGNYNLNPDGPFFNIWQLLRKGKRTLLQILGQDNVQDAAGKIYITWREHRQKAAEIRNELPNLSSALEEYATNIKKIIDIAEEKSVRLIFMTQPTIWKSGLSKNVEALLWLGGIGDFQNESGKSYYSIEALQQGMEEYNGILLEICQERQMECVDLSSILEKDTTVFYDDVHFNESGARKVSNVLSNYILSQKPFRGAIISK